MVDPSTAESSVTMPGRKYQSCKLRRQSAYALLRDFKPAHGSMKASYSEQIHDALDNDNSVSLDYESDDFSHITLIDIKELTASHPNTRETLRDATNPNNVDTYETIPDATTNLSHQQKKKIGKQMKHFHSGQNDLVDYGTV